jgi:hypothetical protein
MRSYWTLPALGVLVLVGAVAADAVSPGPATRKGLLPLGVCEGGSADGDPCLEDFDCEGVTKHDDGECSTRLARKSVRAELTLIADKDSGGFDDTSAVPEEPDALGTPIPTDLTRSTLTVMLEFEHRGRKHVLTETYKDLGDYANPALLIDCHGFCVPTWREPAVEARIASVGDGDDDDGGGAGGGGGGGGGGGSGGGGGQQAGGEGIRIQWAPGGAAMQAALIEALGLPEGSVAFLEEVRAPRARPRAARDGAGGVRRLLRAASRTARARRLHLDAGLGRGGAGDRLPARARLQSDRGPKWNPRGRRASRPRRREPRRRGPARARGASPRAPTR